MKKQLAPKSHAQLSKTINPSGTTIVPTLRQDNCLTYLLDDKNTASVSLSKVKSPRSQSHPRIKIPLGLCRVFRKTRFL